MCKGFRDLFTKSRSVAVYSEKCWIWHFKSVLPLLTLSELTATVLDLVSKCQCAEKMSNDAMRVLFQTRLVAAKHLWNDGEDEAEYDDAAGVANGNAASDCQCRHRWRHDIMPAVVFVLSSGRLSPVYQLTVLRGVYSDTTQLNSTRRRVVDTFTAWTTVTYQWT